MRKERIYNPLGNAPIYTYPELDSTMLEAERLIRKGAGHGTVVVCEYQTAGRGRGEASVWDAEQGSSLLATVVLSPEGKGSTGCAPVEPLLLPLITGLAVAEAVESIVADEADASVQVKAEIKWPNDVFIGGRKVAGVLCRARAGLVLAGFGVNCLQTSFPESIEKTAASLFSAAGVRINPRALLPQVLRRLSAGLCGHDIPSKIEKRLLGLGQHITIASTSAPEGPRFNGTLLGLDSDGALLFLPTGAQHPMRMISGRITLRAHE
ncbi:MAG: biotin--[acetyl-CoA-carboxylase] ligase [Spirochaeta sp.]|nr:biotin--[acetyl-CoA-carboxylase] ligase [Spirochaeta sp.]